MESHGIMRVLQYAEQFQSGYMNPKAKPKVFLDKKGFNKVEIPGERERLNRKNSDGNIKVPEKTWKQILELHKSL